MNPRWLLLAATLLSCGYTASGQTAGITPVPSPYQGPVIVDSFGSADPYATVGTPSSSWWQLPTIVLPTTDSLANRFWFRLEYLRWRPEGMDVPALVTTSPPGTPQNQAGVLGESGTTVLFGGGELNGSTKGGVRTHSGFWFRDGAYGIESEFFQLEDQKDSFFAGSDGSAILGRPFFDIVNGRQTAQLISFPNLVSGNIGIGSRTKMRSYLLGGRASLLPAANPPCADRVDLLMGYRYLNLKDELAVVENLTSLVPSAPGTVAIAEGIQTKNRFDGFQLGVTYLANFRRAWLETMLRVGIGNNQQSVTIGGLTNITEAGTTETFTGGILAQRTNIGNFRRNEFTMIPEVGLNFGYRITSCCFATLGYTVLYFPNVVRAGDQIDTDINPNLIPEETVPFTGALRPRFRFVESDYWVHGVNLGAEFRF